MDYVLEKLDSKIIAKPNDKTFARIHRLQRDLLVIRRHAWPMKEVVYALMRDEKNLISKETELHLRDCHDHITQIIDRVEAYREVAANLVHAYEFAVNRQTNEVMRILMIFSTIFLPLTFIVGIYGMNFNTAISPLNMPELNWTFGYPFAILLMVGTVGGMLLWFRKRAWIEYPWERKTTPPPRPRGVAASAPKKPPRPPRSA
jgi:magnesium transporter